MRNSTAVTAPENFPEVLWLEGKNHLITRLLLVLNHINQRARRRFWPSVNSRVIKRDDEAFYQAFARGLFEDVSPYHQYLADAKGLAFYAMSIRSQLRHLEDTYLRADAYLGPFVASISNEDEIHDEALKNKWSEVKAYCPYFFDLQVLLRQHMQEHFASLPAATPPEKPDLSASTETLQFCPTPDPAERLSHTIPDTTATDSTHLTEKTSPATFDLNPSDTESQLRRRSNNTRKPSNISKDRKFSFCLHSILSTQLISD